jgi:hypothetical protein
MHQPDPLARRSATSQRWRSSVVNFHGFAIRHCPSGDSNSPRSILRQSPTIKRALPN